MTSRLSIESALRHLAPRMPVHEFAAVVDHALDSPGLRAASPENAAWLSLVAYARHAMTDYDDLLAQGYDRDSARHFVTGEMRRGFGGLGCAKEAGGGGVMYSPDAGGSRRSCASAEHM